MTSALVKHMKRYEALIPQQVEDVDNVFDCLCVLYQIAVNVKAQQNGTFRFVVRGMNNFETFRDFAERRCFPFSYQTTIVREFEIFVDVPALLTFLNKSVNRGV
jgi:hypothetical protein